MVTMWEARAAAGRAAELAAWAVAQAPPGSDVYASADERVVVIGPAPLGLPELPAGLVARPPHAWDFDKIR